MTAIPRGKVPEMTADELASVLGTEDAPAVLDVREPDEFEAWSLPGALNIPMSQLATEMDQVARDREVVVVCASGARSARMTAALVEAGVPARNLAGGMLAWSAVYDTAPLDLDGVKVIQVRRRGKGCLSYIVGANGEAFVVDPSLDVDRYLSVAGDEGWRITRVFDTHLHADHLSGVRALAEAADASIHLNATDGYRFDFEPLGDGQWFTLGGKEHFGVTVFDSPGHTPGSTLFEVGGRVLLSGDTLFVDGVGRPDLADQADAFARDLFRSLHSKVISMPVDVMVCPAHFSEAVDVSPQVLVGRQLGQLRSTLPQLTWTEERFVTWASTRARPRPPNSREIVRLNAGDAAGLEAPTDDLRRLELGPNRCAA